VDEDPQEVASLPPLNSFRFTTFTAFKSISSWKEVTDELAKRFTFPPDEPEYQRIRILTKEELLERSKFKQYLTEEEATNPKTVPAAKLCDVLAKCTYEQLLAIEAPLRRAKKD